MFVMVMILAVLITRLKNKMDEQEYKNRQKVIETLVARLLDNIKKENINVESYHSDFYKEK